MTATVYGLNRRGEGLQFTMIDDNNVGVGIFDFDSDFGYTVTEGDMITVQGTVGHFNGLTQITPDTIMMLSSDNPLVNPRFVDLLDESTESSLIEIQPSNVEDEAQWLGDGGNFNVNFLNQNGDILLVRIEDQTDLSTIPFQGSFGTAYKGIGGQFDTDDPRDEGYQLLPRNLDDITFILSNENIYQGEISIYPNPIESFVTIEAEEEVHSVGIFDLQGRSLINSFNQDRVDVSALVSGSYMMVVYFDETIYTQKIFVN